MKVYRLKEFRKQQQFRGNIWDILALDTSQSPLAKHQQTIKSQSRFLELLQLVTIVFFTRKWGKSQSS